MSQTLTRDEVLKIAKLAKIKIAEDEVDDYLKELSEIIEYVKQLDKVDTKGLKPTNQVSGLHNVFRSDEVINYGYSSKELLDTLNNVEDSFVKVKRVIE